MGRLAQLVGYLGWLVGCYYALLVALKWWKRSRSKLKSDLKIWKDKPHKGTRAGGAQWGALCFACCCCGILLYFGTRSTPLVSYACPASCLGIVKVEGPNALETVNLQTNEHREWRFLANPPIRRGAVFPGYVIEVRVRETPAGEELDEPSASPPYHIVRGKDIASPAYAPVEDVTYYDGPDRPVLARNCRNTPDDTDVVCEGGDAQFQRQLGGLYAQPARPF